LDDDGVPNRHIECAQQQFKGYRLPPFEEQHKLPGTDIVLPGYVHPSTAITTAEETTKPEEMEAFEKSVADHQGDLAPNIHTRPRRLGKRGARRSHLNYSCGRGCVCVLPTSSE
jgi:hypothetical protein